MWPPVLFTYIHKYPNNLFEDDTVYSWCNMHGLCCKPPSSVQKLYNGGKYDKAADPAPQSGTYR